MEMVTHRIKIRAFGMIAEKLGADCLDLDSIPTTEVLRGYLYQQFPELEKMKFGIAINKKLVSGNQPIPNEAEVALLPPFSGG
ncbi:MoaD/ThiS family protein [Cecembia sp.]|uniref:MoaD/ThiS family protein n=1 Tax=Cecembia sp. TaxID=1898110 RepID=UPI0025C4E738|nr:MoaD/ThiS family protein [Cecembia sp.]